jgi:hypothetical protein
MEDSKSRHEDNIKMSIKNRMWNLGLFLDILAFRVFLNALICLENVYEVEGFHVSGY